MIRQPKDLQRTDSTASLTLPRLLLPLPLLQLHAFVPIRFIAHTYRKKH